MKKTLIAIAAMAAAMVGCTQYGEDSIKASDAIEGRVYYGHIQEETRTILDLDNHINWEAGDQLSVFEDGEAFNLKYDVVLADGATTSKNATFKYTEEYTGSADPDLDANYAIFPYSEENSAAGSVLSFPMPEVIDGAVDGNIDHLPMVATTPFNNNDFWFSSPVSLLRVRVSKENNYPNTVKLLSLTLTSRKGQPLWGTASVDMSATPYVATIENDSATKNSVTVNFGEGVEIDFVNKHFYIAIPAMTFEENDLQITFVAKIGKVVKDPVTINRVPSLVMPAGTVKQTSIKINAESFSGSTEDASPVANVNGVEYTTLEAAFKAAIDLGSEQTISVVADASVKEAITVPASSKINLILNGNNVTSELTGITITNNGTLNVMGGTITAAGETIRVMNGGSLTVGTGATVASKTDTAVFVPNGATANVVVYGTLHSDAERYAALQTNGMSSAVITIEEGAKIIGTKTGAMYCPGATITINGGEITGSTAIYHKKGSLVINGGTFTATGTHVDYGFNGSGANATSDALVVEACDVASGYTPCSVEIYGGTFVATDTANGARALAFYEQPGVTVDPVESTIIAGTYNTDPNEYVTRGYKATQNAEGLWVVGEDFEASIGSTKYVTVAEAFAAAQKGNTITLLKDVTLTESIVVIDNNVLSDITLDGAGKTVTLNMTSGTGFQFGKSSVSAWATGVKIKDLTIKGTATYALYLCGGTSSVIDNLTVEGTYDNGGYGAVILYGTHGATISNSNICSGFSNGSDVYPLNLVNTQWGELFINASEIDATAKLFIDDQSYVDKVICGSYKSNMVDYDSIERIGTIKAEIEKKGSTTYGEYDMVAELGKVLYASVADAAAETTDTNNTVVLYNGEHNLYGVPFPVADIKFVGENREQTVIKLNASLYWTGKSVSFENLTYSAAKNAPYDEQHMWIHHANNINFEKCNIERLRLNVSASLINDCVLSTDVASGFDGYPVYYSGNNGSNHKLTNSKINGVSKGAVIYNEGHPVINLTVENCQFTATTTDSSKAAIQMHSEWGISGTLVVNNSTATGFADINGGLWNEVKNNVNPAVENFNFTKIIDGRTYVTNGVWINQAGEYEIENANGLVWFGTQVNVKNNSFSGKTVKLLNDITLDKAWEPVGQTGATQFRGIFDGQDKTITGLTINAPESYSEYYSTGLFGWVETGAVIKNVKLDGAIINGYHYVGAIAGYMSGSAKIQDCEVINSTIVADPTKRDTSNGFNGDKIGGIVGMIYGGNTVSGNTVSATTIKGYRHIGGIIGYSYGTATNNTVGSGVVINVDNSNNYKSYKVKADYGVNHIAGVVGSGANVDNTNTGEATINWGAISESNPGVTINPGQGDDIDW